MARADETRLNELLAELKAASLTAESGDALGDLLAALPELVPPELDGEGHRSRRTRDGDGGGGGGEDADNGYEPSTRILLTCTSSAEQENLS